MTNKNKKVVAINNSKTLIAHNWWATNTPRLSPPRSGNDVEFFICGEEYFKKLAEELEQAKKYILITDWVMNPEIHLIRSGKLEEKNRLISILTRAANRGVIVRILLYDSYDLFGSDTDLDDLATEKKLENAHKNIRVHRLQPDLYYSPHQKTVIIDSNIAYIGGLDLAYGRWDNAEHTLYADQEKFPDEFYNPRFKYFNKKTYKYTPRMPWQDVHARIMGPSALDIERNFTQRWAAERELGYNDPELIIKKKAITGNGSHRVQIIRSINDMTIKKLVIETGLGRDSSLTETSIAEAYIKAIEGAQHYIYIENQFFISNFGTANVKNQIANAIAKRIIKAIDKSETFRVYILLPVHPEGKYPDKTTNELIYWQQQTILRSGTKSLIGQIQAKLKKNGVTHYGDVSEYINFFCLRTYGKVGPYTVATEQIYVHTKLMIIDDRIVILGSANINDRSLIGSRDNEISAIFLDKNTKKIKINNKDALVRVKAHDLRVKLWEKHLGKNYQGKVTDPTTKDTLDIFLKVARKNTEIFESYFTGLPSDQFPTYADQGFNSNNPGSDDNRNTTYPGSSFDSEEVLKALKKNIEGHLTMYPLDWLLKQKDLESLSRPDAMMTDNSQINTETKNA